MKQKGLQTSWDEGLIRRPIFLGWFALKTDCFLWIGGGGRANSCTAKTAENNRAKGTMGKNLLGAFYFPGSMFEFNNSCLKLLPLIKHYGQPEGEKKFHALEYCPTSLLPFALKNYGPSLTSVVFRVGSGASQAASGKDSWEDRWCSSSGGDKTRRDTDWEWTEIRGWGRNQWLPTDSQVESYLQGMYGVLSPIIKAYFWKVPTSMPWKYLSGL